MARYPKGLTSEVLGVTASPRPTHLGTSNMTDDIWAHVTDSKLGLLGLTMTPLNALTATNQEHLKYDGSTL